MGFMGTGIAAASIAAKLMSGAAIANGGGVAAGSLVAALQPAGGCGSCTCSSDCGGFTGTGIAAASIAAKMMSAAATANGGGVAAGSLVATLQSVGKCPFRQDDWRDIRGWHLPSSPFFPLLLYHLCLLVLSLLSGSL
ncbi:Interferon alpha-inducible protein 27-like protein 2A [Lemmus lemmus]